MAFLLQPYLEIFLTATTIYFVCHYIYNLWFHPLRNIPGPALRHISVLPWAIHQFRGRTAVETCRLHDKYGPVVRISPNHLSFTDSRAWREIYGHRVGELAASAPTENPKAEIFYRTIPITPSILEADRDEHSQLRRALSSGFSERSVRGQESIIKTYVDLLVRRLRENGRDGEAAVDVVQWLGYATSDVVSDLVFSKSFGMLEKQEMHPFVAAMYPVIVWGNIITTLTSMGFGPLSKAAFALTGTKYNDRLRGPVMDLVGMRIKSGEKRNDLFQGLVPSIEKGHLDMERATSNAALLVLAGSVTTKTTLCGTIFFLLKHPRHLCQLQQEIRSRFKSADEITITAVGNIPYLLACLSEAMRLYPPVTNNQVREVAEGGQKIAGCLVPAKTLVEVQPFSMHKSSDNWAEPLSYRPERFLRDGNERWAGDKQEALQPFNTGPRNCLGRNLAYAEMRLILARLVYEFDFSLGKENHDWMESQRSYGLWIEPPLLVHMTPVAKT